MNNFRMCCGTRLKCRNTKTYPSYVVRYYSCSKCGKIKKTYETDDSIAEIKYQLKLFTEGIQSIITKK